LPTDVGALSRLGDCGGVSWTALCLSPTVAREVWRSLGLPNCASAVSRTLSLEKESVVVGNGAPDGVPNSTVGVETDNATVGCARKSPLKSCVLSCR